MTGARLRLAVAGGGVLGATVRLIAIRVAGDGRTWLWVGIGVVNVVGCAIVGAAVAAPERFPWSTQGMMAVTVGFCGGLTTFATLAVEVALAVDDGAGTAAAGVGWAVLSLGLGVAAVVTGRALVRTDRGATQGDPS